MEVRRWFLSNDKMSEAAWQVFYTKLLPLLDEKATKVIFANVEDILLTNTVS